MENVVSAEGFEPSTHALNGSPTQLQTTTCTSNLLHARHNKINEMPIRHRSGCPEGAWNPPQRTGCAFWRVRLFRLLRFEPIDGCTEPGTESFLDLPLSPRSVQRVEGFSARRQRDMNASGLLLTRVLWHELHQEAFAARFTILGVKV